MQERQIWLDERCAVAVVTIMQIAMAKQVQINSRPAISGMFQFPAKSFLSHSVKIIFTHFIFARLTNIARAKLGGVETCLVEDVLDRVLVWYENFDAIFNNVERLTPQGRRAEVRGGKPGPKKWPHGPLTGNCET